MGVDTMIEEFPQFSVNKEVKQETPPKQDPSSSKPLVHIYFYNPQDLLPIEVQQ